MGGGREGEELRSVPGFGADTFHQKSPGHQQARRQTWAFLVQNWVGRKDMPACPTVSQAGMTGSLGMSTCPLCRWHDKADQPLGWRVGDIRAWHDVCP